MIILRHLTALLLAQKKGAGDKSCDLIFSTPYLLLA